MTKYAIREHDVHMSWIHSQNLEKSEAEALAKKLNRENFGVFTVEEDAQWT
jgi:hypothetical protein